VTVTIETPVGPFKTEMKPLTLEIVKP